MSAHRLSIPVTHGACAGTDHLFLTGFTRALNDAGLAPSRFSFPYADTGKRRGLL